jgi:hypothetical protein
MNAKTYSVRIEVNTDVISMAVQTMLEVRRELAFQLKPNPLATSELAHIRPASESGVSGNEVGKSVAVNALNVLAIFDAACVKHCLERLKIRVLAHEIVRH